MCYNNKKRSVYDMAFSYKPLWKLLIDKDLNKKQLMAITGISKSTMDKMARSEIVSLAIIDKLCTYFNCPVDAVIEHVNTSGGNEKNGK